MVKNPGIYSHSGKEGVSMVFDCGKGKTKKATKRKNEKSDGHRRKIITSPAQKTRHQKGFFSHDHPYRRKKRTEGG